MSASPGFDSRPMHHEMSNNLLLVSSTYPVNDFLNLLYRRRF
jgi:hypothetical protein